MKNKKIFLYMYIFFIIYSPRLTDLYFNIRVEFINVAVFILMFFFLVINNRTENFKVKKDIFKLMIGIMLSSVYFMIRATLSNGDIRIFQNLYIIIQIFHILFVLELAKNIKLTSFDIFEILLKLAKIQGIISIIMLVFPSTKKLALNLYYLNIEENVFISRMRIYGLSSDYTFFTPVYHGILLGTIIILLFQNNYKFIKYIPYLFLVIILNGRTGIVMVFIPFILMFFRGIINLDFRLKNISVFITTIIFLYLVIYATKFVSPFTYSWLMKGFEEIKILLFYREQTGTFETLKSRHLFFPKGMSIIFGEGFRVYGKSAFHLGYSSSDIGFVNDLFMGGVIYISILYGSIYRYIFRKGNNNNVYGELKTVYDLFLFITLFIANVKGEAMRGGLILISIILLKELTKNGFMEGK